MTRFEVYGPFKVPVQVNPGGKAISSKEAKAFWESVPSLKARRGCYVFGVKASKGMRPLYVGKATKSLGQEVFTNHKIAKYMQGLSHTTKGTPVLLFVCAPIAKGATNKSNIDELESFLIQEGLRKNPKLLNERKTATAAWSIAGVLRDGKGKPSNSAQALKTIMSMR